MVHCVFCTSLHKPYYDTVLLKYYLGIHAAHCKYDALAHTPTSPSPSLPPLYSRSILFHTKVTIKQNCKHRLYVHHASFKSRVPENVGAASLDNLSGRYFCCIIHTEVGRNAISTSEQTTPHVTLAVTLSVLTAEETGYCCFVVSCCYRTLLSP